ncbi:MAG: hypothetical protein ACLP4V_23765 [Methylocella sp.]
MTSQHDNGDEQAVRELVIVLLTNMLFSRSLQDLSEAIARMVDEALADPHGQLAQDLRQIGVPPQLRERR